jgi:hypothetical protein
MAAVVQHGDGMRLSSEEEALAADGTLPLSLDLTTEQLSLAGIDKELDAYADSEVLRAVLDEGLPPPPLPPPALPGPSCVGRTALQLQAVLDQLPACPRQHCG